MYVSPAVRSLRDDPLEGESVSLLVEVEDDSAVETVAGGIRTAGGTVEDRRRFGTLLVTIPQECIEALCSLEGIAIVETDNVGRVDPDGAGEDVEFEE